MSAESGLAAVHAATDTISRSNHEQALATAREEGRVAGFAAGRTEGATVGATAERERILGIEGAALPGHGELIAKLKADPSISVGAAALQINAAERSKLDAARGAIQGVENATGKVAASVASDARTERPGETAAGGTPETWATAYKGSPKLQGEFPSEASYVAAMRAEAAGKVRYLGKKA